jgi:hypothetical protein
MQQAATRSRQASTLCLGALIFAALTASASAQVTSAQQGAIRSNCRSDFQSHCSGVTPGGKDALACLQNNVAKLSAGCQTAVRATLPKEPAQAATAPAAPPPAAAAAPAPAAPEKPATIVSAPPPKAQPAKRPVQHPATAAVAPVHAAPAAAAAAQAGPTSAQRNAMRQNCRNDFTSKCAGVQPGGKDALACLQQNVAGLSPACKRVVSSTMKGAPAAAAQPAPAQPAAAAVPAMVPGGVLVEKACARYILMNCAGTGLGTGPKVACMVNFVNAGNFVGPRCRAALNVTGQLH